MNRKHLSQKMLNSRLLRNHTKALTQAWEQMTTSPLNTLIICTIMATTLFLTSTLLISVKTFNRMTQYLTGNNQITLYLNSHASLEDVKSKINQIRQFPLVKQVTYISPEEALKELSNTSDYKEVLTGVENNPLPPVILIRLSSIDHSAVQSFLDSIKGLPWIHSITVDYEWLHRLSTLVNLGNRIGYALSGVFAVGILFIIGHSIQSATQKNQLEIQLLQLIGAPTAYIRRPFLYLGLLFGIGASLITILFLGILHFALKAPLGEFFASYNLRPALFINFHTLFLILILSGFLGFAGAWLAFYRYASD